VGEIGDIEMPKFRWEDLDDDFEVDEEYIGFQKIPNRNKKPSDESSSSKKKNSPKHNPRPDKS
jgi:hypothetical protein